VLYRLNRIKNASFVDYEHEQQVRSIFLTNLSINFYFLENLVSTVHYFDSNVQAVVVAVSAEKSGKFP
jgi:hypothetical protein